MAVIDSKERCFTLTSSDDEEKQECMPRIIDAVSLQGSSTFRFDDQPEVDESIFYPKCEIREENKRDEEKSKDTSSTRKPDHPDEEKKVHKEKKRLKLTRLTTQRSGPDTLFSRHNDGDVVDANKLALQENLFKTKELFDTFLRVCQDLGNSAEMQKVVPKLDRAYGQARQEYLGSVGFQNLLESETEKVNTSNTKPWLNMKLVRDEMKHNKKCSASKLKLGECEDSQDARSEDEEPIIECPKSRRHLKKLEKTLRYLNLKIKHLEEKEVDLEDDDSSYIKLDRYRVQFTKIYNKVCEIKGKLPDADRPYLRKVSFAGTSNPHINRCIERFYNKHRDFPDFQDIKKLVIEANKQANMEMPPVKVHQMAMNAFKEFGEMLKRLRQYDDYDIIISYLENQVDPAGDDQELLEQLSQNAQLFKKKEQEVIDKFAAEDAGIHSESEEGSDSKPKKKRKIVMKNQKKPTAPKTQMSISESSDDSLDETEVKSAKGKNPGPLLDSSDESSKYESKKVMDKGKTLVGKKRVIKRGSKLKQTSPKKPPQPQTPISSDEERNPKDTLTKYLGLHNTSQKDTTEGAKSEEESDDEIICIQNIKKSPPVQKIERSEQSSDSDVETKPLPLHSIESDSKTANSSKQFNGTRNHHDKEIGDISDSEPPKIVKSNAPTIMKKEPERVKKKVMRSINKAGNGKTPNGTTAVRLDLQSAAATRRGSVGSDRISLSSDSDNESAERTSADESEFSAKKSISDASKAPSLDHSANSSDSDQSDKDNKKDSDVDDSIVILSEEVVEVPKTFVNSLVTNKTPNDSDSDNDICVLSQSSTETRTVAPRRTKVHVRSQVRPLTSSVMSTASRKPQFTTSTPVQKPRGLLKRRGSGLLVNGVSKKTRGPGSSSSGDSVKSKGGQMPLPQVINGAARKTVVSRVPRCKPTSSPDTIPLIELD